MQKQKLLDLQKVWKSCLLIVPHECTGTSFISLVNAIDIICCSLPITESLELGWAWMSPYWYQTMQLYMYGSSVSVTGSCGCHKDLRWFWYTCRLQYYCMFANLVSVLQQWVKENISCKVNKRERAQHLSETVEGREKRLRKQRDKARHGVSLWTCRNCCRFLQQTLQWQHTFLFTTKCGANCIMWTVTR